MGLQTCCTIQRSSRQSRTTLKKVNSLNFLAPLCGQLLSAPFAVSAHISAKDAAAFANVTGTSSTLKPTLITASCPHSKRRTLKYSTEIKLRYSTAECSMPNRTGTATITRLFLATKMAFCIRSLGSEAMLEIYTKLLRRGLRNASS